MYTLKLYINSNSVNKMLCIFSFFLILQQTCEYISCHIFQSPFYQVSIVNATIHVIKSCMIMGCFLLYIVDQSQNIMIFLCVKI